MLISAELSRRVLLVGPHYRNHRGGIGGVLAVYAQHFARFRFIPSYRPFRWKVLYLPYFLWNYLRFIFTLAKDPELRIVHIHGASEGSVFRKFILFWTAKHLFKRRVLFHLHSPSFLSYYADAPQFVRNLMRRMAEESDGFICLSESWQRECQRVFPKARIQVLPNVIEPPKDLSTKCRHDGPLRLVFLGLIGPRKGVFDLLRAFHQNQAAWAGRVELTIGGNGEVEQLMQAIQQLNLTDQVHYAGWVTGATKEELLRQADAFVLPSYAEGLPMSILEAMSQGLPILSTQVGGIPEIVTDGENGFLVSPGDEAALARCIQRWIDEPEVLIQMSQVSAERAQTYYPKTVFSQLASQYLALLANESFPLENLISVI